MRKKIAILGGGLTGLTAGYFLAKKNYQITIFEKKETLGGLASGFKKKGWQWYLDYTYHHIFSNDNDIIDFAKQINFNNFFFRSLQTASIFDDLKIRPIDTPIDFLKLDFLNIFDKLRAGLILIFLKISPFLKVYENQICENFLKKTMGKIIWDKLWQELFRKKFGKYAENVLASFFWARIKKRTKKLGYPKGGFQNFINYIEKQLKSLKVKMLKNHQINEIKKTGNKFIIDNNEFDYVISTLPTPILIKITEKIFPAEFLQNLRKINYLHAKTLIIEVKKPLLEKIYWLNVNAKTIPIMVIVEHTNFIDKKNYAGNHLIYLGWYLEEKNPFWSLKDKQLLNTIFPYLKKINPLFEKKDIIFLTSFQAKYAQPIFDKNFINYKPNFITPIKNFLIANLDMTYPYDRGTNYAVKIGKKVNDLIK